MLTNHFFKTWLPCASIQLIKNYLFTEVKLKFHGSTKLKLTMFYFNLRDIQEQSFSCSSSRSHMFFKIDVLKIFAIFAGKHQDLQACKSIKKRLQHKCFPVNIAKILRTAFFMEHLRWLLLQMLYKKAVPKNFANFTRTYHYRSPFLSSCRLITCKFVKIVGPVGASGRGVLL